MRRALHQEEHETIQVTSLEHSKKIIIIARIAEVSFGFFGVGAIHFIT